MKKTKVALIRGAFAHSCELQNYALLPKRFEATCMTSQNPLQENLPLKNIRLTSLTDVPVSHQLLKPIANRTIGDMHMLFQLENELRNFDIIHTADPYYYYSYQAALTKIKYPQKKLISTYWETKAFQNETIGKKKELKKFVTSNVDHFIVHTKKARSALLAENVPLKKVTHLYLGIDLERFSSAPKKNNVLLFVGRLVPEKDPLSALISFVELRKEFPTYKLHFVGNGPLKSILQRRVDEFGLTDSVSFYSYAYEEIHKAYQKASICIFPTQSTSTWEEQYGFVYIEALASGLPIVTTLTGAVPEIIGNTGTVVPEKNQEALTNALLMLTRDKKLRTKHGTMARKRAELLFNRKRTAREISNLYETTLRSTTN